MHIILKAIRFKRPQSSKLAAMKNAPTIISIVELVQEDITVAKSDTPKNTQSAGKRMATAKLGISSKELKAKHSTVIARNHFT